METKLKKSFSFIGLIILLTIFGTYYCTAQGEANVVLLVKVDTEITDATTSMIKDALGIAEIHNARMMIVLLNTPGGEVGAVKDIMDIFEASKIPICTFVYPPTATAWSGGTYILMASTIAVMASGTTIGSCQPVYSTGQPINYSKYINAYTALMRDHARLHSRNETAAKLFITENINMGPEEALRDHIIEIIADNPEMLLKILEKFTLIQVRGEAGTLTWKLLPNQEAQGITAIKKITFEDISKAEEIEYKPGIGISIQQFLYNPLVYSLLLTLGMFILLTGLHTPGFGAEIVGTLCILLSLAGLGTIGITISAVALFALGFFLVLAELKTHIGVLALSGSVCLILGSLLIFPSPQWLLYYKVSEQIRRILLGASIFVAIFFSFLVYKIAKARYIKVATGEEALIGAIGTVVTDLKPKGEIRVYGEYWQAMAEEDTIKKGERVEVLRREGMFLIVKPFKEKV